MTEFSEKVVEVIKRIPRGKVASYGQIAALAGNPKGSRAVVYILRSTSNKENLPWHRILGKKGNIRIKNHDGFAMQKALLEEEGIPVNHEGKVNMILFGWDGQ